jgi:NAD(P)-dependent dehydrogenase (short-subunit alcohol dehydrogenase family)
VITTVNVFRAALPALPPGSGSLVAVGAAAAVKAGAGMSAYAGTKAAMMRMIESFADEFRATGPRVNAVLPGTIDTPQIRAALPDADPNLWVKPAEIASVIAFLLSPASSGVTGALIPVTGRG